MKQYLIFILLSLFLGVVTTVGVAWTCAWLSHPLFDGWNLVPKPQLAVSNLYLQGIGDEVLEARWRSFGFLETDVLEIDRWKQRNKGVDVREAVKQDATIQLGDPDAEQNLRGVLTSQFVRRVRHFEAGWPFPSLSGMIAQHPSIDNRELVGVIPVMRPWTRSYASALPLISNWNGFILNTCLYAVIIGCALHFFLKWRRKKQATAEKLYGQLNHEVLAGQGKRKRLRHVLASLLLGVLATVLIAWGFAWYQSPFRRGAWVTELHQRVKGECWSGMRYEVLGDMYIMSWKWSDPALSDFLTDPTPEEACPLWAREIDVMQDLGNWSDLRRVEGFGWPMLSMCCAYTWDDPDSRVLQSHLGIETGQVHGTNSDSQTIMITLPLAPIWPGFIFNSIVFGVIIYSIVFHPWSVRRDFRLRRGRCPICTYNLRGDLDSGCPECGWNRTESKKSGGTN